MKLLRIIASMDPATGGPCQGIRYLTPELQKHGIFTEVVSLDNSNLEFVEREDFTVYPLNHSGPWRYSKKLIPWLLENARNYDVIIVHGLWLYPTFAVWRAFNICRDSDSRIGTRSFPKVFVMPHGMLDPYFQKASDRKIKAIRNSLYWRFIESKVVNSVDGLMFTCYEELNLAKHSFKPYFPKAELNVGYGIPDPPAYHSGMRKDFFETCPQLEGKPFILFLSRLHKKKGVDLLLDAYEELIANKSKNAPLPKLVIAGPGLSSAFGTFLTKRTSKSGMLKSNVVFTGMLTGDVKWGAIYSCEAYVLPSHQENFGISVVEALACHKPVLISNKVNIWKEIRSYSASLVCENTKVDMLRMLEQWLSLSTSTKQMMAQQARRCFEEKFDIRSSAKLFIEKLLGHI